MKRIKKLISGITTKLIFTIIISLMISIIYIILIGNILTMYIIKNINNVAPVIFNLFALIIILGSIICFIITFYVLVNKRVKYIMYLSQRVKNIANGSIGDTIEVIGNDEIAELTKSINNMSKELKRMFDKERQEEKVKNDLIVGLAHDIKTPLTTLMGYLEILQNTNNNKEGENEKYINLAYNASHKIKKIVDDLFEFAKLNSVDFKLQKQEVNLATLVIQIAEEYKPIFQNKNLSLEYEIESYDINVNIDIEQFVRVMDNLISNALKYSNIGSTVFIKLFSKEKIELLIINQSKILDNIDIERMFQKFYKGDISRGEGSSGLGLAISKKIMELHGGNLSAIKEGNTLEIVITF